MEKAILKTLAYADIFDYPLKGYEIHKWLIGHKATLQQVEKALQRLSKKAKIKSQKGYYFLASKDIVRKRLIRQKQSAKFLLKAKIITWFLKVIPWIKLVGVSGGLAMENAEKWDDIDLFLITAKNRLWLSRFLVIGLLDLIWVRRKAHMKSSQVAGKLCPNILLEEDRLEQDSKDLFVAHEVLQMKVLWQRGRIYQKYLEDNQWVFRHLPNWISNQDLKFKINDLRIRNLKSKFVNHKSILDHIENLAKKFQLWYMKPPKGMERIEDGALYFHPNDIRPKVLSIYKQKVKNFSTS